MKTRAWLLACALCLLAGSVLTELWRDRETVAQLPAAEVRTAPHDVVPATTPNATPSLPAPTKARGGKTLATTEVHADGGKPVPRVADTLMPACPKAEDFTCPPLDLRFDLNQTDDGQWYAAVRGTDGREITGRFITRTDVQLQRDKRLTVVGNPAGDVVATFSKDFAGRWAWAASAGYIDGAPWGGAGVSVSWR